MSSPSFSRAFIQLEKVSKTNLSLRGAPPSRVVLSQTFKTLTKFIEKNAKIYSTKLIPLDLLYNIFL